MYTHKNFKTKAALKKAVLVRLEYLKAVRWEEIVPAPVTVYQPNNMFGVTVPENGKVTLEGPHYPAPHRWYAEATICDGEVVKVK